MEFRDLKGQYRVLKKEMDAAVLKVMGEGRYILGPEVMELESELAGYVGTRYCITCANGTDALQLGLMAMGVGEGDAVFVPDFTFFSTAEVVCLLRATPVFVDVDERTFNMSPEDLEKKIGIIEQQGKLRIKCIIPVDLFGLPADYKEIRKIADKHAMEILEDGAQGFGGTLEGKKSCSFGDISTTSFFPAKPLGCYGDGGAIFTDREDYADTVKSLRIHGKGTDKYDNVRVGLNSRLDTLQAAVLRVKLKAFDSELRAIQEIAEEYDSLLKDRVRVPFIPPWYTSSFAQYTIQVGNESAREKIITGLKAAGIPVNIYYKKPLHRQKAVENSMIIKAQCPVTEKLSETVISLPMHPYLEKAEIRYVAEQIERYRER